jgi:hypothetical protein
MPNARHWRSWQLSSVPSGFRQMTGTCAAAVRGRRARTVAARNFTAGPSNAPILHAMKLYRTFGKSGQTKSQRSSMLCASRLRQSPLSCSFHFIIFALLQGRGNRTFSPTRERSNVISVAPQGRRRRGKNVPEGTLKTGRTETPGEDRPSRNAGQDGKFGNQLIHRRRRKQKAGVARPSSHLPRANGGWRNRPRWRGPNRCECRRASLKGELIRQPQTVK